MKIFNIKNIIIFLACNVLVCFMYLLVTQKEEIKTLKLSNIELRKLEVVNEKLIDKNVYLTELNVLYKELLDDKN